MTRIFQQPIKVLNSQTATGIGVALNVQNYRTIVLQLATSGSTNATIKIAASLSLLQPDFSAPSSPTNQWSYVVITDLSSGSGVLGNTGIVLTGTDKISMYELSTDLIRWVCPIITARSAGTISMDADAVNETSRG